MQNFERENKVQFGVCDKKRDARAELLFCLYHKLYFDVIVAVALVVALTPCCHPVR